MSSCAKSQDPDCQRTVSVLILYLAQIEATWLTIKKQNNVIIYENALSIYAKLENLLQITFTIYIIVHINSSGGLMPIYEYQCPECGQVTEKIQSTAKERIQCPGCTTMAERRVSCAAITSSGNQCGTRASSGFT